MLHNGRRSRAATCVTDFRGSIQQERFAREQVLQDVSSHIEFRVDRSASSRVRNHRGLYGAIAAKDRAARVVKRGLACASHHAISGTAAGVRNGRPQAKNFRGNV